MTIHRLHRVYDIRHPDPLRVEIHDPACDCPACAPYRQSPAAEPALTFAEIGNLAWLGLAIGTVIAFAIDPAGAWHALTAIVGR